MLKRFRSLVPAGTSVQFVDNWFQFLCKAPTFESSAQDIIMSDNLTIEAQAKKFQSRRLSDSVYELLREPNPDVEVVFFPGLQRQGSKAEHAFWRTWKMRESEECWPETLLPQLLVKDKHTQYKARVLAVSYENRSDLSKDGNGTNASDDYLIVERFLQDLILGSANVGQKKRVPVVLVGHDLGGILIKLFVMKVEDEADLNSNETHRAKLRSFLTNLKSVFFYATPHYGSDAFNKMAAKLKGKDANLMLPLMTVLYKDTGRINADFQRYRSERLGPNGQARITTDGIHALHVTNEGGYKVQVVPEGSVRSDVDHFYSAGANHFTVCQPNGTHTTEVIMLGRRIIEVIEGMKQEAPRSTSEVYSANGSTQNKRIRH